MKKISSALLIGLSFVIGGCNWFGDGGSNNIIAPSPVIVQAMVLPTIVEYNGSVIISWQTQNATKIKVDGIQVNESSIELKNLTENKAIEIIAYGEEGTLPASKVVQIIVSAQPVVPTASDTISSHYWYLSSQYNSLDNINWGKLSIEGTVLQNKECRFYTGGKYEEYKYPYSNTDLVCGGDGYTWKVVGRNMVRTNETFSFTLTKDQLTLFWQNEGTDLLTGKKFPVWNKIIYVAKK